MSNPALNTNVLAVASENVTGTFMESFFHSMKTDVIHGNTFTEDGQILSVLRGYIPFYNHSRMHSSLNYVWPATYENRKKRSAPQLDTLGVT